MINVSSKKSILYYSARGEVNTEQTLREAKIRAKELGVTDIRARADADTSAREVTEAIQDYIDRGIGLITFRFTGLENLHRLATEVLPQFQSS